MLLGFGMSLSFVHGKVMFTEMTVAADCADHGPSSCDSCGGGDHKHVDPGSCLAVCGSAAQGLMPGQLLVWPAALRTGFQVGGLLVSGQFHNPDHGPPKIFTLG
jgi:hypothetical protein